MTTKSKPDDRAFIGIRLPKSLHRKAVQFAKRDGFGNVSEFIRSLLRERVSKS